MVRCRVLDRRRLLHQEPPASWHRERARHAPHRSGIRARRLQTRPALQVSVGLRQSDGDRRARGMAPGRAGLGSGHDHPLRRADGRCHGGIRSVRAPAQRQPDQRCPAAVEVTGRSSWTTEDPSQATTDRIVSERAAGHTFSAIAQGLNDDAVETARGGASWYPSTVKAVLTSADLDRAAA